MDYSKWYPAGTLDAEYWDDPPEEWWDEDGITCLCPHDSWWEVQEEAEQMWELHGVQKWSAIEL